MQPLLGKLPTSSLAAQLHGQGADIAMALILSMPSTQESHRWVYTVDVHKRTLARLYQRKAVLDYLIDSLESYQTVSQAPQTPIDTAQVRSGQADCRAVRAGARTSGATP